MAATINNFISALRSPEDFLTSLKSITLPPNFRASDVHRTKLMAEAEVLLEGERYRLSMPLSAEALSIAERAAAHLNTLNSKVVTKCHILPDELHYIGSAGQMQSCTLILERVAAGEPLAECARRLSAEELSQGIIALEREFERLSLSNPNLKIENIVVGADHTLYPQRLHYCAAEGYCAHDFEPLHRLYEELHEVPLDSTIELCEPTPAPALYGYKSVGNPFEGLCVAESAAGYGYIDSSGNEVIKPQYIWASDLHEGRAEVETPTGMGLIDAEGEYILKPIYQIVEFDSNSCTTRAKLAEQWHTFDYNGREIF